MKAPELSKPEFAMPDVRVMPVLVAAFAMPVSKAPVLKKPNERVTQLANRLGFANQRRARLVGDQPRNGRVANT